ncbi:MAG: hypothetical protein ACTSXA_15650 [Candidatus Heimdallarchaeota archaeon]
MKEQPAEELILDLLYQERQRKRVRGLKLACDNPTKKVVDYVILLTKLDESIKVRRIAVEVLGILLMIEHSESKLILAAVKNVLKNDPSIAVKTLAREIIENQ